jgi:hypothetical protein
MEKLNGPLKPDFKRCLVSATGSPFPPDFMVDPIAPTTGDPLVHRIPGFSTIITQPRKPASLPIVLQRSPSAAKVPVLPRLSFPLRFHDPRSRQG